MDDETTSLPAGESPDTSSPAGDTTTPKQLGPRRNWARERLDLAERLFVYLFRKKLPKVPPQGPPPRLFISLREIGLLETPLTWRDKKFFKDLALRLGALRGGGGGGSNSGGAKSGGDNAGKGRKSSGEKPSKPSKPGKPRTQSHKQNQEPQVYSRVEFSGQRIIAQPDRPLVLARHLIDYLLDHSEYSCHYAAAADLQELSNYIKSLTPINVCNNSIEWVNDKKRESFKHADDPDYIEPVESRRIAKAVKKRERLRKGQLRKLNDGEFGTDNQFASGERKGAKLSWMSSPRGKWWFGSANELFLILWRGISEEGIRNEMALAVAEKRAREQDRKARANRLKLKREQKSSNAASLVNRQGDIGGFGDSGGGNGSNGEPNE